MLLWRLAWLRGSDWRLRLDGGRVDLGGQCSDVGLRCSVADHHIGEQVIVSLLLGKVDKHLQKSTSFSVTLSHSNSFKLAWSANKLMIVMIKIVYICCIYVLSCAVQKILDQDQPFCKNTSAFIILILIALTWSRVVCEMEKSMMPSSS